MPLDLSDSLVIAVSARALFDAEGGNRMFLEHGYDAYSEALRRDEDVPFAPGPAFHFVRGIGLADTLGGGTDRKPLVEVVLLSSQSPDTAPRLLHSIAHHGLPVRRLVLTGGAPTAPYLEALGTDLLLTRSAADAQDAVDSGVAAGVMYDRPASFVPDDGSVRIAFDGDSVLFSDESEAFYKANGLDAFRERERENARVPMGDGPFGAVMRGLHRIQKAAPGALRVALVTARDAPAHERALRTLRSWGVGIDEAFFLGGMAKAPFLAAFRASLFLDDQDAHLGPASLVVPCARVPYRSGSAMHVRTAA